MAYDSQLYLHDPAVSASLWVGNSTLLTGSNLTKTIYLGGTPLRGLNCNIVLNSILSTPSVEFRLFEGVSSGATFYQFRRFPTFITTVSNVNFRFHLDKGNKWVKAGYSFSAIQNSSGCGFPGAIIRVGMDEGSHGNAY